MKDYAIDEYLTITANTHKVSGEATDASAITYRIYDEEDDAEIISDQNMTKFDSETGFYLDREQLTVASGFGNGKTFTVLIKATVDGIDGTFSFQFTVGKRATKGAVDTVDTVVDGIKTITDAIPDSGALTSLAGDVTAVKGVTDVIPDSGALTNLTGDVTAVKNITDNLPDSGSLNNLDAAVSSRSTLTAANVWGYATRTLSSFGTLVADIWATLTSALTTVGSVGKLIVDYLNTTISSRSTFDSASDEVDIGKVKGTAVTDIDDFKQTAGPTAAAIADAVWEELLDDHVRTTGTTRAAEILRALIIGNYAWNSTTKVFTIYAKDNSTVLAAFTISGTSRSKN